MRVKDVPTSGQRAHEASFLERVETYGAFVAAVVILVVILVVVVAFRRDLIQRTPRDGIRSGDTGGVVDIGGFQAEGVDMVPVDEFGAEGAAVLQEDLAVARGGGVEEDVVFRGRGYGTTRQAAEAATYAGSPETTRHMGIDGDIRRLRYKLRKYSYISMYGMSEKIKSRGRRKKDKGLG